MPTPNKKEQNNFLDTPFRRKEDQLKYEITNKMISMVKWLIVLNGFILYFFFSEVSENKALTEYQLRLMRELGQKIDQKIPDQAHAKLVAKTIDYLNENEATKQCVNCHNKENPVKILPSWGYKDFRDYIRGDFRIIDNPIMPKYTEKEFSERDIEKLYFRLMKDKE